MDPEDPVRNNGSLTAGGTGMHETGRQLRHLKNCFMAFSSTENTCTVQHTSKLPLDSNSNQNFNQVSKVKPTISESNAEYWHL